MNKGAKTVFSAICLLLFAVHCFAVDVSETPSSKLEDYLRFLQEKENLQKINNDNATKMMQLSNKIGSFREDITKEIEDENNR